MKLTQKIKIILEVMIIIVISLQVIVNAKYNYNFTLNAFTLKRDNTEIKYTTNIPAQNEYTNQDIMLEIMLNKPIEKIDGFELSEDRKKLSKLIKENETNNFIVEDISGNKKEITYSINNIDKIPPQIIGVEDGETYNTAKEIQYNDNVGIKDIFVDRFSKLTILNYPDYYDTSFYKGIDITKDSIYINVTAHPKGTKNYAYYLNNKLVLKTTENKYKFTKLTPGTMYNIKVEAQDENGRVIEEVSQNIKTKYFSSIELVKTQNNVKIKLVGLDSKVSGAYGVNFIAMEDLRYKNTPINPDRSLNAEFSAYEFGSSVQNRYYYYHIILLDVNGNVLETVCCNIIFGTNYSSNGGGNQINPNKISSNGEYQIIVTDLAGNKTEKNIKIMKN